MQKQTESPCDNRLCVCALTIISCVTKQAVCFFKVDILYSILRIPWSPLKVRFLHSKWVFLEKVPLSLWPVQLRSLFLLLYFLRSTWNNIYSPFYFCKCKSNRIFTWGKSTFIHQELMWKWSLNQYFNSYLEIGEHLVKGKRQGGKKPLFKNFDERLWRNFGLKQESKHAMKSGVNISINEDDSSTNWSGGN